MDIDQQTGKDLQISSNQTVEIVNVDDNSKFIETVRHDHPEYVKDASPFNNLQNKKQQTNSLGTDVNSRKYMSQTLGHILQVEQCDGTNSNIRENKTLPLNPSETLKANNVVNQNGTISGNIDNESGNLDTEFPCLRCDLLFPTRTKLTVHMQSHILGSEEEFSQFRCHFCDAPFKTSTGLFRHEVAHENEKEPFLCRQCGSHFAYLAHRDYHKTKCFPQINGLKAKRVEDKTSNNIVSEHHRNPCNNENTLSVSISSDASFLVQDNSPGDFLKPKFDITDIQILDVRGSQYQYRPDIEGQSGIKQKLASPLLADEATSNHVVRTQLKHQPQSQTKREQDGSVHDQKTIDIIYENIAREEYAEYIKAKKLNHKNKSLYSHYGKETYPTQVIQNRSPNYTPVQQGQFLSHTENDKHFVKAISPQFIQADTNYHSYHLQNASEGFPPITQQKSPNGTPSIPGKLTNYAVVNQDGKSPQPGQIEASFNQAQLVTEKFASHQTRKPNHSSNISHAPMFTPIPISHLNSKAIKSPGISPTSMFTSVPTSVQAPVRIQSPVRIESPMLAQSPIQIQSPGISETLTPPSTSLAQSVSPNLIRPSITNIASQPSHFGSPFFAPPLQTAGQYPKPGYPPGTVLFYPFMPTGPTPNFIQHQMYEQYMHAMNPRQQFAQTQNIDLGHYQPYLTTPVGRRPLSRNAELSQSHQLYPKVVDPSATVNAAVLHAQQLRRKDANAGGTTCITTGNTTTVTNASSRDSYVQVQSGSVHTMDQNTNDRIENNDASTQQQDSGHQSKYGKEEIRNTPPPGHQSKYRKEEIRNTPPPLQYISSHSQKYAALNNVHDHTFKANKRRTYSESRYYRQNLSKRPSMVMQSPNFLTAQVSDSIVPLQEPRDPKKVRERKSLHVTGQNAEVHQTTGQMTKSQQVKGDELYQCDICNRTFSRYLNFSRHQLMHAVNPPYECKTCGRVYTQKSYLEAHMHTHEGELPEECDVCGRGFLNKPLLGIHKLEAHSYNSK